MEGLKTRNRKTNWLVPTGIVLIVTSVVLFIWFFMQGQTTVNGKYEGLTVTQDLVCVGDGVNYPIFNYHETNDKQMRITAIFNNDKLGSVSLIYKMVYANDEMAKQSSALNHAAMNNDFGYHGLHADYYDASYSRVDNTFQMTLYASGKLIDNTMARYFMLDNLLGDNNYTQDKMAETYSSKGLECTVNKHEYKDKEEK